MMVATNEALFSILKDQEATREQYHKRVFELEADKAVERVLKRALGREREEQHMKFEIERDSDHLQKLDTVVAA